MDPPVPSLPVTIPAAGAAMGPLPPAAPQPPHVIEPQNHRIIRVGKALTDAHPTHSAMPISTSLCGTSPLLWDASRCSFGEEIVIPCPVSPTWYTSHRGSPELEVYYIYSRNKTRVIPLQMFYCIETTWQIHPLLSCAFICHTNWGHWGLCCS